MSVARSIVLAALCAALVGCGGELTEIVVAVDSDLSAPLELDGVRVQISGVADATASGSLIGDRATALPSTVGVVHRGGSLGPLEVIVVGSRGGVDVVSARAITSFVRGRTLVLPIFLSRHCAGVSCGAGQTCAAGACASATIDPATLEEWRGGVGRTDGGIPCGTPVEERCNDRDDDCDGRTDEGFDLDTDPLNCGACMTTCARPNATSTCEAGACAVGACDAGFADCDADPMNGCEIDLATDPASCGACGAPCDVANATAACVASTCAIGTCDAGWDDCDGDAANGCETPLDTPTDCGACAVACAITGATTTCAGGTCAIETCDAGLGDCNADPADGCELALDALTDCGACGMACDVANGTETCATGACEIDVCDAGFADCDADPTNGCERSTTTLTDCGGCGVACALPNGTETCATGTCEVDVCSAGRGDCDAVASNGCEIDLRTDELHCGTCGNVCAAPDQCRMSMCR